MSDILKSSPRAQQEILRRQLFVLGDAKTADDFSYVQYNWKKIVAARKFTPRISRTKNNVNTLTSGMQLVADHEYFREKNDNPSYFESASLSHIVDLIGEGPIEGFSDKRGETIRFFHTLRDFNIQYLKSIFLNDTPILNEKDGTFNFRVFSADFRSGLEKQACIPNFKNYIGKTIFYNSALFPANKSTPKAKMVLKGRSGTQSDSITEIIPFSKINKSENQIIDPRNLALSVGMVLPGNDGKPKQMVGVVPSDQKMALHNKFKEQEKFLHPVVHTVTDPDVDAVSISINIHALSKNVVGKRSVKTKETDVSFLIYVGNESNVDPQNPPILEISDEMERDYDNKLAEEQTDVTFGYRTGELIENDSVGYFVRTMKGLATSDYLFETKIHLPPNPTQEKRIIRVARIDPDEEFRSGKDTPTVSASLHSIVEMYSCKLSYPNSAIIATGIDSRAFANVPDRKYLLKLLKMKVPSNYLPDTKEYIGNWNGKFKSKDVINTSNLTGDSLFGSNSSSYKLRSAKIVLNEGEAGEIPTVSTSVKKFGSGSIFFPSSSGFDLKSEEQKPIIVRDSFTASSNPYSSSDSMVIPQLPLGSFPDNFTIEFYIKVSESQLLTIHNVSNQTQATAAGAKDAFKFIMSSNGDMSAKDGVVGFPEFSALTRDAQQGLIDENELLNSGRLLGGQWFIAVTAGTTRHWDRGTGDLESISNTLQSTQSGRICFKYNTPQANISYQVFNSSLGTQAVIIPEWSTFEWYPKIDMVSTTSIADDAWHHVAICRNGDEIRMFIDGQADALLGYDGGTVASMEEGFGIYGFKHLDGPNVGRGQVFIGGKYEPFQRSPSNTIYGATFNGYLDEIFITSRAKYTANFNNKTHPRGGAGINPDDLRDLIQNDLNSELYINGNNRQDGSTDIFDYVQAVVDESFRFDEDAEFDSAELQWTDNPAWILYDLITNKRYGLGKFGLTADSVDKWSLYEIAKYCDEKVKTGLHPKYKPRDFVVSTNEKHDKSRIEISGFSNQAEFEKEFPEYSTIALYDLDDEKNPVHRRIKYLRRLSAVDDSNSSLKETNERFSVSNSAKLISYQGSDENSAGSAIIELQKIISPEECIRIQPGFLEFLKTKTSTSNATMSERVASTTQLILQYIDDPTNKDTLIVKNFDVKQKINETSTSGLAATEFYGHFDIIEPRFSANLYITTQVDAYKILNDIASIFRGITYFANGKIFAHFDKKRDAVLNFTNANVKDGNFSYSGSSKHERFTTCLVRYVDKYENYKPKIEYVEDPDGIIKYGIVEKDLVAFGCASRSQARRLGNWFLFTSQYETETVEFSAGKECAYLRPGDVIKVIDKTRTQKRFGGRVTDFVSGEQKIKVDLNLSEDYVGENIFITVVEDFEFSDSLNKKTDKVTINDAGKIEQKTISDDEISNIRKSQVKQFKIKSISLDKSVTPHENRIVELEQTSGGSLEDFGKISIGSIFILTQANADVKVQEDTFKVINVMQASDVEYEVQAVKYVDSKYDVADNIKDKKLQINYSKTPLSYSRPAKPIGVPRIALRPINEGFERELTVAWKPVTPTPEKYKIVAILQGENFDSNSSGKRIVLIKNAKDSDLNIVDTSVSVNIGDFSGNIDVQIYTIDENNNIDLVYY